MKRSTAVPLTIVSALASVVGACGPSQPAIDPCEAATFNQPACEYAIEHQGYYYNGTWYPHVYGHPFLYYSQGYGSYIAGGGRVRSIAPGSFEPRAGVVRGGFGGIGEAHSAASAGA